MASGSSGAILMGVVLMIEMLFYLHITAFAGFSRSYISMLPSFTLTASKAAIVILLLFNMSAISLTGFHE